MSYLFEWDPDKERGNVAKHGIDFDEAASVFADPLAEWGPDKGLHTGADRFVALGWSYAQRMLVVVFTVRGKRVRIISARKPTRREAKAYEG
jgi:uncharacterized DUF497 family protein